jgi:Na+-transporting methylmalonyl-CoA/oxaloacetate decarboxylase gamma subunit
MKDWLLFLTSFYLVINGMLGGFVFALVSILIRSFFLFLVDVSGE